MNKALFNVTENDCQEILSSYYSKEKHFQINNISVEPISNIFGFLGEHYILKFELPNAGGNTVLTFFVKSLKQDNELINKLIKSGNLFNKEVGCYKFFEMLRTEHPSIDFTFCAKYYHSRENEFIVLENLSHSGYEVIDVAHLDVDHMKVALSAIAKFHAGSLIYEEITSKKLNRRYSLSEDYSEYLQEALFKDDTNYLGYKYVQSGLKALHTLIDQLPCTLSRNDFKQKLSELGIRAYEEVKPSTTFKNVLCHGDLWVNNIMFLYKGGIPVHCKIIDFQFVRYIPPAFDVLLIMYDSTDTSIFKIHLDVLLKHYYKCLENEFKRAGLCLENTLSFDEFGRSVKKLFPVIKLIKSIHKVNTKMVHHELCFDVSSEEVTRAFKTREPYRTLMTSLLEELEHTLMNEDQ